MKNVRLLLTLLSPVSLLAAPLGLLTTGSIPPAYTTIEKESEILSSNAREERLYESWQKRSSNPEMISRRIV